ncbi:MAG: hypothetical protein IPM17_17695 [Verrucomicrobia bacterium]|nr:hypothetical protein [Verrucomicrobiota bacterium]
MVTLDYGTAGGGDDLLSRLASLKQGTTVLAGYSYLGLNLPIRVNYSGEPGVELTYLKQGAEPNGDAGDQYTGLDRFGRLVDQRWLKTSDGTHRERVQYGFDRAGNRVWRDNLVGTSNQDEYYLYDNLYQLKTLAGQPQRRQDRHQRHAGLAGGLELRSDGKLAGHNQCLRDQGQREHDAGPEPKPRQSQ